MKKTLLSVFALFTFSLCNAQVKTQSNYDVDGNGKVTIEDVTSTVNKVLGKASDDRTLVDGESLNATLQEILSTLKSLDERIANIEKKNCTCNCEGGANDPYNGHEYVDLGLPSGLKWATCNVGAEKPEDYGKYYAWGETSAYGEAPSAYPSDYTKTQNSSYTGQSTETVYDWSHYKYMTNGSSSWSGCSKYTFADNQKSGCWYSGDTFIGDNKKVLDLEDDAAHVNWGGDWRMPTKEEQDELRTKCKWTWGSQNGVNGYTVVGPNGNSLFLPAAGYRYGSDLDGAGSYGYYWSSSLSSDYSSYAYYLYFYSGSVDWGSNSRSSGRAVRPVCPQP